MTPYLSDKIKILSFISIILVLYLHANFPDEVMESNILPVYVRKATIGIIGPCAVPLFFFISGFLFFLKLRNGVLDVFVKQKRRIKTLLIPFVIAAIVFPLFFIVMESIPGIQDYLKIDSIIHKLEMLSMKDIVCSLFYDSGDGSPWAYHLWFLRDLIIIVAISPLLFFIRKSLHYWCPFVFFILSFVFPTIGIVRSIYWFLLGSTIIHIIDRMSYGLVKIIIILFLMLSITNIVFPHTLLHYCAIFYVTLGVISLWKIYDMIVPNGFKLSENRLMSFSCQFTFFIYLFHLPLYNFVVRGIPIVLGQNAFGYLVSYLFSPIIFTPFIIVVGWLLRCYMPMFYNILVGGR